MTQETNTSIFQLVAAMNTAFGNPKGDPLAINGSRLLNQCKNIASEFKELMQAFGLEVMITYRPLPEDKTVPQEKRTDHIRDALCDIKVFADGAFHFMGMDADEDMREVVRALYTRFCRDQAHLEATMRFYDAGGIEYYVEGTFPTVCLKSAKDQGEGEYPKGKFLKAVGYEKPKFRQYRPEQLEAPARRFMGQPAAATEGTVEAMAAQREQGRAEWANKMALINAQVAEYRNKLETEAFGLPNQ